MASNNRDFVHKTSLGQNFLVNRSVLKRTVERASIKENDVILEIGPGQGVLTREILTSPCRHLHSVEIDRRLEPFLADLQEDDRFDLHWGDGVTFDYTSLVPLPNKIVANIPYHITTPFIWALLESMAPLGMTYIILMVQKEAADRLIAPPRTKERYPLGITIEAMGEARTFMKVSPGSFNPAPRVSSALIEISIKKRVNLANDALWRKIIRAGFAQRRKKLLKNLSIIDLGIEKKNLAICIEGAGLGGNARAEELSVDEWLRLRDIIEQTQKEEAP